MSKTMRRILRLRALKEETRRVELEAESQQLRRVQQALDDVDDEAHRSRRCALDSLGQGNSEDWLVHESAWEFAQWQREDLARFEAAQAGRVEDFRESFLESRKETRQVETLLRAFEELLRMLESRREQAAMDEWFNLHRQQVEATRRRLAPQTNLDPSRGDGPEEFRDP